MSHYKIWIKARQTAITMLWSESTTKKIRFYGFWQISLFHAYLVKHSNTRLSKTSQMQQGNNFFGVRVMSGDMILLGQLRWPNCNLECIILRPCFQKYLNCYGANSTCEPEMIIVTGNALYICSYYGSPHWAFLFSCVSTLSTAKVTNPEKNNNNNNNNNN